MRVLSDNQQAAVGKLAALKVGALYMSCGTGKTQTAVAWVNTIPDVRNLVWLCPCRCKENTEAELAKCGLKYQAHIFGIESMSSSATAYNDAARLLADAKPWNTCLILDESLMIKNPTSKRTRRIIELGKLAEYKLILNGTPVTRNILDIWAQMQFLSPLILNCDYWEFQARYAETTTIRRHGRIIRRTVDKPANEKHLLSLMAPYSYTCNLRLDIGKEYYTHECYLTESEMEDYRQTRNGLVEEYTRGGEINMGAVLAKIQHSYCTAPAKFRLLEELLTDPEGNDLAPKTLVYCKFVDSAEEVRRRYPHVAVKTYGKDAIGLNLQAYNRIVFFDKTYDYALREQSEARIYRTGQVEDCEYHDITLNTGVDRMIDACIAAKKNLLDFFMGRSKQGSLQSALAKFEDNH